MRFVLIGLMFLCAPPPAQAGELARLVTIGPWPVVSRLIGYRGRLWFANSQKGVDHNSADLYSLDPHTGAIRFERHLFSQDAGRPLVAGGRLYWPYEDPRYSLGWGAVDVTNGRDWRHVMVPGGTAFHVHALANWRGKLVAAVSAWSTGLRLSADGGRTWTALYQHPKPRKGQLSRLLKLVVADGELYARMKESGSPRLVHWTGTGFEGVPDWPQGRWISGLVAHKGRLYGAVDGRDGPELWTSDGKSSRRMGAQARAWRVRDMVSDGAYLWAVTRTPTGAGIWRSADGRDWRKIATAKNANPYSLTVLNGHVYVGGRGADGRGGLWGVRQAAAASMPAPRTALRSQRRAQSDPPAGGWAETGRRLDSMLSERGWYESHGRAIRDALFAAFEAGAPPGFFARRLLAKMPPAKIDIFGGKLHVAARTLGQTLILWAMGLAEEKTVPLSFLRARWTLPPNPFEKYIDPLPRAIWAVALSGQNDRRTIDALIARLGRTGDPLWLKGDAAGALAAVTGERYGMDFAGWISWWKKARPAWRK